ncbi:hypothetical protein P7K49_033458, partial [Saguinus oedipus]
RQRRARGRARSRLGNRTRGKRRSRAPRQARTYPGRARRKARGGRFLLLLLLT